MSIRDKILNGSLYALATAIIISTIVGVYLLLVPITILENWKIEIPNQASSYRVGDNVILQSTYDKTRDINGVARRHLECTSANISNVSYPINTAIADHPSGKRTGTGVDIIIPQIPTPAKCRFEIDVTYKVYPFRSVTEYQRSNTFNVTE